MPEADRQSFFDFRQAMDDPPSYEESASNAKHHNDDIPTDAKTPQRFSIREEVGVSRTQHVAALVSKLFPQIRSRAKQGLSKSNILLLPSNQGMAESDHELNSRRIVLT